MSYLKARQCTVVGADVFIVQKDLPKFSDALGAFSCTLISNRGNKVWPGPPPQGELVDVYRCRFLKGAGAACESSEILALIASLEKSGFEWTHIEKLLVINGKPGYSKADGEA